LKGLVQEYGARKWSEIAIKLGGRVGKQCRERYCLNKNVFIFFYD